MKFNKNYWKIRRTFTCTTIIVEYKSITSVTFIYTLIIANLLLFKYYFISNSWLENFFYKKYTIYPEGHSH